MADVRGPVARGTCPTDGDPAAGLPALTAYYRRLHCDAYAAAATKEARALLPRPRGIGAWWRSLSGGQRSAIYQAGVVVGLCCATELAGRLVATVEQ